MKFKLVNGIGKPVKSSFKAITKEASWEHGVTGIVFANLEDGSEISISQHEDLEWNVTEDSEPVQYFDADDKLDAFGMFVSVIGERTGKWLVVDDYPRES